MHLQINYYDKNMHLFLKYGLSILLKYPLGGTKVPQKQNRVSPRDCLWDLLVPDLIYWRAASIILCNELISR